MDEVIIRERRERKVVIMVPTNNSNYKDLKIIFKLINGRGHNKSRRVRKVVIMPPAPLGLVGR